MHLQSATDRVVFGFDSNAGFDGAEWSDFRFHGYQPLPDFLLRHEGFIEGWFEETLRPFLGQHEDSVAFVHYDAGELNAARFVLTNVFPRLTAGSVLVFDEMLATDNEHSGSSPEWVAFHEAVSTFNATFEWVARSGYSASVRITSL